MLGIRKKEFIPLYAPTLKGREWDYVKECLNSGWVSSSGPMVSTFEERMAAYAGSVHAIAVQSGTAAIHLSLLAAGVNAGDYVILPNLTFVAPANAIKYVGAEPLLIDVELNSWQLDLDILEEFLATHTEVRDNRCVCKVNDKVISALLPVHVLGNMGDMHRLAKLSKQYQIPILEDAAEAVGSRYRSRHAGSWGLMGCLSFNGNKVITTGGGGMVLTNSREMERKVRHLSTQAKTNGHEYMHDEVGYNYRMSSLQAALGLAQLEQVDKLLNKKNRIASYYDQQFSDMQEIFIPKVDAAVKPNHWLYTILVPDRKKALEQLANAQIEARPMWVPLNRLPAFQASCYLQHSDVADFIHQHAISLPSGADLHRTQLQRIGQAIQQLCTY